MPDPAMAGRWSRGELGREPRGEWAKDAVDALVAGMLLTVTLVTLLG